MIRAELAAGLIERAANSSDLGAVFALTTACDVQMLGEPDYDLGELRDDWRDMDLGDSTRVVEDAAGTIVGYAAGFERTPVRLSGSVYVHPRAEGLGIGTWLTRWVEGRARTKLHLAPEGARVVLECGTSADYALANALLSHEGFAPARYFLRMVIDLKHNSFEAPAWPDGIAVRTLAPGVDDVAVYEAVQESFADHWGHTREPYEEWRKHAFDRESFDPSLKFLATAGNEIAGVALCRDFPSMDQGWIDTVGVRRPWRRKGVALALLQHAFAAFDRRGRGVVGLGVDAQSLTGATRVYEKAGMRMRHRFALYAKELRPGVETTTQELGG
jgi:GNAT superfamily N-acetyltransferase